MPKYKIVTISNASEVVEKLDYSYIYDGKVKWYSHSGKQFDSLLENMQLPFFKKWGIFIAVAISSLYWFMKYSRISNCYNADAINPLLYKDTLSIICTQMVKCMKFIF